MTGEPMKSITQLLDEAQAEVRYWKAKDKRTSGRIGRFRAERDAARANWAVALLARDEVQGRAALERMVAWYEEHDGRADDFGELWIVKDARKALASEAGG